MNYSEQKRIEQFVQEKRDSIAWLNAKNNACAIVAAEIVQKSIITKEDAQALIQEWTEWIYQLQPKNATVGQNKRPGGISVKESVNPASMKAHPISPKQIAFIEKLADERDVEVPNVESLDSWQASQKINELMKFPVKTKSNSQAKSELDFVEDLEVPENYEQ